ncbi:MAG TPA: phage holin family protein [Anaerolineae bacterium]|nr:phage holin family protein [Anaerolineae bacterium]
MRTLLIRWGIITIAVWIPSLILPGIHLKGRLVDILFVSLLFGLVNAIIKPIVKFLTCPLIILTLGLFTLVINMLMLLLVDWLAGDYLVIDSWSTAFLAAIIISIVTMVMDFLVSDGS